MTGKRGTPEERFWPKVSGGDFETCWEWTAAKTDGYGVFHVITDGRRAPVRAHRYAYQILIGGIPDGFDLDHLCRNRGCVNPWHLDPVPRVVNVRRGQGHGSETHCPSGHAYTEANTYIHARGDRQCRSCIRVRSAQARERRRAA